jgi:hypothetical protein
VDTDANDRPLTPVIVDRIEIFQDTQNEVLVLSVPNDVTSVTATFEVTVTDNKGNTFSRQFDVNVQPDTSNSLPFLTEILADDGATVLETLTTPEDTPLQFQLTAYDPEQDAVRFIFVEPSDGQVTAFDPQTGEITYTPPADIPGDSQTVELLVGVQPLSFEQEHLNFMWNPDRGVFDTDRGRDFQLLEIEVTGT